MVSKKRTKAQHRADVRFRKELAFVRTWNPERQLDLLAYFDVYKRGVEEWIDCIVQGRRTAAFEILEPEIRQRAEIAAWMSGLPNWRRLRVLIYARDKGICAACGKHVTDDEYHLGHLQDRVAGGSDTPDNLTVMCETCNMLKGIHETPAQAREWCRQGGPAGDFARMVFDAWNGLSQEDRTAMSADFDRQLADVKKTLAVLPLLQGMPTTSS